MSGAATQDKSQVQEPYKEFDAVLAELDAFNKAVAAIPEPPATQAAPKAAAPDPAAKPAGEAQPSMLEKALQGGESVELDGEAVMKAMSADLSTVVRTTMAELSGVVGTANAQLLKGSALMCKALIEQGQIIKAQDLKIEALSEEVATLGGKPRMRKSVLNIHERGEQTPASQAGTTKPGQHPDDPCSRTEFMEKAVNAGIGGANVSVCRQHLNLFPNKSIREAIPPHIYAAVMKESK